MLQTRISQRMSGLALVLLLCACMRLDLSEAEPSRSCLNTATLLQTMERSFAHKGEIYEQLKEVNVNGVCKLDKTCCSQPLEADFKMVTTGNYRQKIQAKLIDALMPCHNQSVHGEIAQYISASKVNLVSHMRAAFGIYFNDYVDIFDEFYSYLEDSIATGDLCQVEEKFAKVSFELFLAAYVVTNTFQPRPATLPDTDAFRSCFYDYFLTLRGDTVLSKLNGFLRAFNFTLRYTRALKMLENVIEGVLDLPLSDQCQSAIMKMTHCSQCAGYSSSLLPCQGLCLNSLRGCLIDLADLVGPVRDFTAALVRLKDNLDSRYDPWVQITLLNPHFLGIVTGTQRDFQDINENLFLKCDANGHRRKRSAPLERRGSLAIAHAERAPLERRAVSERAVPPAPFAAMNESSYCISNSLSVFTSLSEELCGEPSVGGNNLNCWTGVNFGSYERSVIDLDRASQKNNPEMVICTRYSRLYKQVAQLKYITKELNILTEVQVCSGDDEDCVDTVPHICNYYEFPSTYELEPDPFESSSGSGEEEMEDEEEDDACAFIEGSNGDNHDKEEFMSVTTENAVKDKFSGVEKLSSMTVLTLIFTSISLVWMSCRSYL